MTTVQEDQVLAEMAWLTGRLLTHKHLMPNGPAVMLRACKSALAQRRLPSRPSSGSGAPAIQHSTSTRTRPPLREPMRHGRSRRRQQRCPG
jgi:hypothetical protein